MKTKFTLALVLTASISFAQDIPQPYDYDSLVSYSWNAQIQGLDTFYFVDVDYYEDHADHHRYDNVNDTWKFTGGSWLYKTDGRQDSIIRYNLDGNGNKDFYHKYLLEFENGATVFRAEQTKIQPSGEWRYTYKLTWDVDANGNYLSHEHSQWDVLQSQLIVYEKATYLYDQNGNLDSVFIESNPGTGWDTTELETYESDANGNIVLFKSFNVNDSIIYPVRRVTTDFDSLQRIAEINYESWNGSNYYPTSRLVRSYNPSNGKLEENIWYIADGQGNLNPVTKDEFTYTSDTLISSASFQIDGQTWRPVGELRYIYENESDTALGLSSVLGTQLQVFPNPSNGLVHFMNASDDRIEQVTLFDAQGRMIHTESAVGPQTIIDLSDLPKGALFYRAHTESGQFVSGTLIHQ